MTPPTRIAIACSGLGHVQRGIESWAADLAQALREAGADVTLFGGAAMPGVTKLPTWRRTGAAARGIATACRHLGGWRYGAGSPYDVEQSSFAFGLWRRIRRDFDILHAQDPLIATWMQRAQRRGWSRPRVIYANGTGEDASVMRQFRYLQLLTASAVEAWRPQQPPGQMVFSIPNFIDTNHFSPGDKQAARAQFGLPGGATILLCCAAIRRRHKRIDALLAAFAAADCGPDTMLVIAGGREPDTDELIAEGTARLGARVRFLPDVPRTAMPALYRAADGFVLASLYEMFGIVLLEAMSSGLPVLCNDTADFRNIAGPAGLYCDLQDLDVFASGLLRLARSAQLHGVLEAGRAHVQQNFSAAAVTRAILAMYQTVQTDPSLG